MGATGKRASVGTGSVEFGLENTAEACMRDVSMILAYYAAGAPPTTARRVFSTEKQRQSLAAT
jgi:hypothetical protein